MCGLGSITFDKTVGQTVAGRLDLAVSALLKALDHRGGDACGIMAVNSLGRVHTQKAPCNAKVFDEGRNHIPRDTRAVAIHTRMATQGHEAWNRNNHPVRSKTTHVMHNGMVWDDHLKRQHGQPEVDTYAIAVLASDVAGADVPGQRHAEDLAHAIADLDGSMAVIVAEEGAPFLATMRIDGSPLYTLTSQGVRISASTAQACRAAADVLEIPVPFESYTYTITKKHGKKKNKNGTRPAIGLEPEGYVAAWCAGTHTEAVVDFPVRYRAAAKRYTSMTPYGGRNGVSEWSDDELYGIGQRPSGNWDPIDTYDDENNARYQNIARKLLDAGDDFEHCELCDEMTDDCERWHGASACRDCRTFYNDDTSATVKNAYS